MYHYLFFFKKFWSTWVDPANTGAPCAQRDRATSLENQANRQLSQLRKMSSKENEYILNIIIVQVTLSTGEEFRLIEKIDSHASGKKSSETFSMSGRPARTPGSRLARSGEEETESTRSFSRPANTPLRECWHLDRHFSTPTYPTQLIGTLFISSP